MLNRMEGWEGSVKQADPPSQKAKDRIPQGLLGGQHGMANIEPEEIGGREGVYSTGNW